jgi:hypothetical protein
MGKDGNTKKRRKPGEDYGDLSWIARRRATADDADVKIWDQLSEVFRHGWLDRPAAERPARVTRDAEEMNR